MKTKRTLRKFQKIEFAKEMILQGYSLNEICFQIEYKSPKHLGRAFKDVTGKTIVEYRNKKHVKKSSNIRYRGLGMEANKRLDILVETINKNPYIGTRELADILGYENISSAYILYNRRTGNNLGKYIRELKKITS